MFIKLYSFTGEDEPQTPIWINIDSISSIRPYAYQSSLTKVTYNRHETILVVSKPKTIIEKINHIRYNKL
jgi:hypothetical protein